MTALMAGFSELDKEADRPEAKDAEITASNYPRDGERASELVLGGNPARPADDKAGDGA